MAFTNVTAIGGDSVTNLNFYTPVLGLRLVKQAVNFDDPTTCRHVCADGSFAVPARQRSKVSPLAE
jgi:catechol 2,3-dioxygenase-like lactoylglutathione lyase family enzyme